MIYLNNAATSWPKPSSVCEAVQACLMDTPASQFRGGSAILKKDTGKSLESCWASMLMTGSFLPQVLRKA